MRCRRARRPPRRWTRSPTAPPTRRRGRSRRPLLLRRAQAGLDLLGLVEVFLDLRDRLGRAALQPRVRTLVGIALHQVERLLVAGDLLVDVALVEVGGRGGLEVVEEAL